MINVFFTSTWIVKRATRSGIRFPVRAARKILKASGKLPLPQDALQEIDLKELMEAVAACLDEEVEGDFVTVETAGGTHVRVYVDEQ